MDISAASFLAAIPNTTVSACFTSNATLPETVNPAELVDQIMQGYRAAQETYNAANTAPPYVSVVPSPSYQPVILDANGNRYQDKVWTANIRHNLTVSDTNAREGTAII